MSSTSKQNGLFHFASIQSTGYIMITTNATIDPNETRKHKIFTQVERRVLDELSKKCKELITLCPAPYEAIITGGFFPSYLNNIEFGDVDFFILNMKDENKLNFEDMLRKNYTEVYPHKRQEYFEDPNSDIIGVYDVISYRVSYNVSDVKTRPTRLQFILTKFKTRQQLLDSFDFIHCKMSFHKDKLYTTREIYDSIIHQTLIWNNDVTPKLWRVDKYKQKGWTIP